MTDKRFVFLIFLFAVCSSCVDENNLLGNNVRLFKNTPVWEVALAIEKDDTAKVHKLLSGSPDSILNYQEKRYGQSLLNWAVYTSHLPSVRTLSELGANPNLKGYDSTNAVINAANKIETTEYLEILIKHGGDVNSVANINAPQHLRTPLMAASFKRLDNVKILINAGANANYIDTTSGFQSALLYAFNSDNIDIINYLIMDVGVEYKGYFGTRLNGDSIYIGDMLRELPYPLESEEYKKKMLLVNFLLENGIDYYKSEVPPHYYQNYDSLYLQKY